MIIKIFYSIALIIFSISMLSSYLEKTFVSNKLYVFSNNHYSMFILGIAITAITQSSTAITALTLSFLNSKKISFKAAVAIILGSNIGTSFTSIITGIQYINYYIIFIIGFIIYMLYKSKSSAFVFIYISFLFLGIYFLKDSLNTIQTLPLFKSFIKLFCKSTLHSYIISILSTFVLQSSSTIIAISQQLYLANIISLSSALVIVLGANVGTTITGLIFSFSLNQESKALAISNLLMNLLGSLLFLPLISVLNIYINNANISLIGIFQLFFNCFCGIIGMLSIDSLIKISNLIINKKTV